MQQDKTLKLGNDAGVGANELMTLETDFKLSF